MARRDRNSDVVAKVRALRNHLDGLLTVVQTTDGPKPRLLAALDRLELQGERWPGSGDGPSGKGGHGDPTAAVAFNEHDRRVADAVNGQRLWIVTSLNNAARAGVRVDQLVGAALATEYHAPNNNPGCKNCRRVLLPDGRPHPEAWQQVYSFDVCEWCYRFERGYGRNRPGYGVPPVLDLVAWHLDHLGSEAPRSLIRDLMPDHFAAREELRRREQGAA